MNMKKILILFLVLFALKSNAQQYNTGIGLRLGGFNNGITLKHFTGTTTALEGIASFGRGSFRVTGLFEKHTEFPTAPGLSWYYGAGAHIGFFTNEYGYSYFRYYNNRKNFVFVNDDYRDNTVAIGADFILGLEYKFQNAPVNIGLDVKPFVDIIPGFFGYWEAALSFRFTL
jgi:hypothetical protein